MFELSLATREKGGRRGWMLALAVGLHGAALASVVLASAWSVGEAAAPPVNAMFTPPIDVTHLVFEQPQRERATPPPAAPPAAPPAPADPAPVQPPPQVTQPPAVPDTLPVAPATPYTEETTEPSSGSVDGANPNDGSGGTDANAAAASAGGDGSGETALALDARMTRPETLVRVQPRYTEAARQARREGVVIVQATIDRTGAVTDVRLVKSLGLGLDEAAIAAVEQWRFKPATLAGRPVPVYFQLSVKFTIR